MSTSSPHRSFWLQEAVSTNEAPAPQLHGEERADVCVVGGGYTGLWTALRLKEAEPSLDVTLLEADICGGGASGRNGGFALSWWVKAPKVVEICGEDDGIWLCHHAQDAIDEIGDWAGAHQYDIDYAKQGWLWTASSKAQLGAWDETVAFASEHGAPVYTALEPAEVEERAGTPVFVGGILDTTGATLQPASLARALRETAVRNGVRLYEGSPVRRLAAGSRPAAVTDTGRVTADRIVLALGAWATTLPELRGLRRAMIITSSDAVATEPIPQLLEQSGPRRPRGCLGFAPFGQIRPNRRRTADLRRCWRTARVRQPDPAGVRLRPADERNGGPGVSRDVPPPRPSQNHPQLEWPRRTHEVGAAVLRPPPQHARRRIRNGVLRQRRRALLVGRSHPHLPGP